MTLFRARAYARARAAPRSRGNCARRWAWRGCAATRAKRAEARDLLPPVYGWFPEGLDTLDLKEAKALLEELA